MEKKKCFAVIRGCDEEEKIHLGKDITLVEAEKLLLQRLLNKHSYVVGVDLAKAELTTASLVEATPCKITGKLTIKQLEKEDASSFK